MTKQTHAWSPSRTCLKPIVLLAVSLLCVALAPARAQAQWAQAGTDISNTNVGNVGVGTGQTAPAERLVVVGNILAGNVTSRTKLYQGYESQGNSILELGYATATASISPFASFVMSKNLSGAPAGGNVVGTLSFVNSGLPDGGEKRLASIQGWSGQTTSSGNLRFYVMNGGAFAERMRIEASGYLGLGTDRPAGLLHVYATSDGSHAVNIDAQGTSGNQQATLNFMTLGDGSKTVMGAGTRGWHLTARGNAFTNAAQQNDLILYSWDGATAISAVQYWDYATGNVGIGTAAPATKLHVAGDVTVDGNINAKYQDVAEWVPSVQKLSAGTVVVLDSTKTNHVVSSSKAYDTAVAGVVSDSPGVILGEGGDGKLKVATTGRVKVKVDATRSAIRVGDLLVTGEVEGVAMKSEPVELGGVSIHRPGTIIGKALEPLERGTGEILVLLSLQ